jgi:hypothetical protein
LIPSSTPALITIMKLNFGLTARLALTIILAVAVSVVGKMQSAAVRKAGERSRSGGDPI